MTAVAAPARTTVRPLYRLTFPRVLRSEWIKISTLRSTWWSIVIVAVLSVGISALVSAATSGEIDAVQLIVAPTQFTMLLAAALGAIAITGEYSTGMIRSTLAAQPRRGAVLLAKALVVAVILFVASLVIFAISIVATAPILGADGSGIPWGDPSHSIVPLLYGALSMAVFALIGLSCGFLLRNGAGAIGLAVGILFVLPIVTSIFPYNDPAWQWVRDLGQYLPMNASQALMVPGADFGLTDPVALLTLGGWVAVGLIGSWAALTRRDA